MKFKKIYLAIATLLVLSMTSCNDYLNVTSPSQADPNFVFSNTDDAEKALMGVYVRFCEDPFTSRMSNVWMQNTDVECMGPNSGVPSGAHRSDIWGLQAAADVSFADIYKAWNNNYEAIDMANQVIQGIKSSAISSNSEMQQMLGEAYCLKAYRYWMLCNFWGDVPYFDKPAAFGQELDKPKTDKNIIYSQCLQDLVNIEGNMKFSDVNTGGIERMNRDFALGLIARIALFRAGYGMTASGVMKKADDYLDVQGNDSLWVTYTNLQGQKVTAKTDEEYYKLADNYAQKLIDLKPRSLRADYASIFTDEDQYVVKNNDEVLYEVAFTQNKGGDVGWCIGVANTGKDANGNTTDQVGINPLYYMSFNDHDIRRDVTCARYQNVNDTIATCSSSTNLFVGKWNRALATAALGSGSSKGTGINWPLMRYSDVLLMCAEAENELSGPTALAKKCLTEVRERAFPAAYWPTDVTNYVDSVSASKDAFFKAIVNERAWEFGGECLRKFDLVRWNLYGSVINNVVKGLNDWAISSDSILMDTLAQQNEYTDAVNYKNWADNLYYTKTTSKINWLNDKYKITDANAVIGYNYIKWGSNLLKKLTTYTYKNTVYNSLVKTTNNTAGTNTYVLDNSVTVTTNIGDSTGIVKNVTYEASDYTTRLYRGYTGDKGYGTGAVPYLLPIGATTLSSSKVLNNDGYDFSSTYTGAGTNVVFTTISSDYK